MYIIRLQATKSGARPPLQPWSSPTAPEDYALCPDEFYDIFYSTSPAGFVDIEVVDNVVIRMTVKQSDVDAWNAEHALLEETPAPTQLDIIEAQVTYTAMMTGTLLEV